MDAVNDASSGTFCADGLSVSSDGIISSARDSPYSDDPPALHVVFVPDVDNAENTLVLPIMSEEEHRNKLSQAEAEIILGLFREREKEKDKRIRVLEQRVQELEKEKKERLQSSNLDNYLETQQHKQADQPAGSEATSDPFASLESSDSDLLPKVLALVKSFFKSASDDMAGLDELSEVDSIWSRGNVTVNEVKDEHKKASRVVVEIILRTARQAGLHVAEKFEEKTGIDWEFVAKMVKKFQDETRGSTQPHVEDSTTAVTTTRVQNPRDDGVASPGEDSGRDSPNLTAAPLTQDSTVGTTTTSTSVPTTGAASKGGGRLGFFRRLKRK